MKAPEKIYLLKIPISGEIDEKWLPDKSCSDDVEYIRKDAFIDKACKYLFENYHGEKLSLRMIESFKNYMKGE